MIGYFCCLPNYDGEITFSPESPDRIIVRTVRVLGALYVLCSDSTDSYYVRTVGPSQDQRQSGSEHIV